MARVPRYQESGVVSGDVPAISTANLAAQVSLQQGIGASLDRLSQFAFGEAKERADQQNRILGIQMRADLEAEVAKELELIDRDVTIGKLADFGEIQSRVKSLQGYASELYKVDVNQAAGLMNSISQSGRALLNKSNKLITDAIGTERDRVTDQTIRSYQVALSNAWQTIEDPQELQAFQDRLRNTVSGIAYNNPSSYTKYMAPGGEYDKMATTARNNVMSQYFTSKDFGDTETARLLKLDGGDAGQYTPIWNQLGETERIQIKKIMYESMSQNIQAKERDVRSAKIKNDETYISNYRDYMATKDPKKRAELAKVLVQSADTVADIDRILKAPETGGDALLFSNLREDVDSGRITDHRQLQKFVGPNGIDKTQLDRLQTQMMSNRNEDIRRVRSLIREQSGIGNVVGFFDPKESRVVKNQAINDRFDKFLEQARKENERLPADKVKPIDYNRLYQDALEDYQNTDGKNLILNEARTKLKNYDKIAREKGRDINITGDTNIEDLKKLNIFKPDQLDNIRKQIETIRNNQTK